MSNEPLVIDGMTLEAASPDGRAWKYVPDRPVIERSASGEPMFSIIEAGPVAFLQCTARLALNDEGRARLLERLKAVRPEAETLEAASITVGRIALEVSNAGVWEAVAESSGSGMPPWTAALAATLAPAALSAIKAAAGGETGHARLRASITRAASPSTYRRAEAAGATRLESPAGVFTTSYATTTEDSPMTSAVDAREISTDLSSELAPGAV
ncbi:MAG TPA: hypothetical protein VFV95_17760 [Vicinamibacterales bacterium]|nr:hypothetical protein [Vicinamibacterales bacterium]